MAKKKKPAANPARGFATISVASKPKQETPIEPKLEVTTPKQDGGALPFSSLETERAERPASHSTHQTPEELEAQLERDELQLLVEKHAAKVRRESRRQVSRFQTERRVLRAQSQSMTTYDWLSENVLDHIVSLAQAESNDSNRKQGQQSLLKVLSEEDALVKLWILELTLRELAFSDDHIVSVLKWLCANAINVDMTAAIWGFQEGLEWLALDQCEGHSFSYDEVKNKPSAVQAPDSSPPGTQIVESVLDDQPVIEALRSSSTAPTDDVLAHASPAQLQDVAVSDLESDLEPDELVPMYLKIKSKLFEVDPDVLETKLRKATKGRIPKEAGSENAPTVRKLLSQLQRLESDPFFDRDQAETQWPSKRNELAQAKAATKIPTGLGSLSQAARVEFPTVANDSLSAHQYDSPDAHSEDEETDLLGEMFAAVPDPSPTASTSRDAASEKTTLRDFGKQSGLSPRRLLEEAIRGRDSSARLVYKLVSPTTYSSRHSLTVVWSKDQDTEYEKDVDGVLCTLRTLRITFTAATIAAVSVEQSEGFISTVALFSLFVSSPKEEKLYLRLPTNWRELYREYLEQRKTRIDAEDRETIQRLRSLIQEQLDTEESEGIVLINRFKLRNQATSNSSTSNSGRLTPLPVNEGLRNFWWQKASTPAYQLMLLKRANLPVFGFRASILSTIDQNQVTIICGETGCGKSTQIPSYILEHEISQGNACKVYCTEPRRISAISLAQRVSEELGEAPNDLGTPRSVVGYAIRLETKTSSQTRLIFATVGVVLRMLESSRGLDEVTHLIIDEVHERSIDTDFLLIILRTLMVVRPELKVVLMSATVDALRFSKYLDGAPILTVPGRTFPVQTKYLEDAIERTHYTTTTTDKMNNSDGSGNEEERGKERSGIPSMLPGYSSTTRKVLAGYDEYGIDYELIVRLIEATAYDPQLNHFSNAFLVFLPGIAEIRHLNDMLVSHPAFNKFWLIYPLHSTISSEDQQAAFLIPPPGVRKIVLATNIAETGVTIPDITCVIDTGKHKEMRFDERRQLSRLTQSFISRANAKQRRGRAGRVQEGLCFHLFTKYRHDNLMTEQQTPEMLRLSLQDLVMRTKICRLGDIEETLSEALDPPSSRNIRRAIDALIEVDALTTSEELTPLGRQIAKLPLDAHLGKLVLLSTMFGCIDVALTIAAILSSKSPFLTPFGAKQRADAARLAFKKGDSDLLTAYHAYRSWKSVCTSAGHSEMQFCHKNFLSPQNLGNIEDLKAQLLFSLADAGFFHLAPDERRALSRYRSTARHRTFISVPAQYDTNSDNDILVNSVIATAFYPKLLIREGKGWRNISNNQAVSLSPTSVNKASAINVSTATYLSYYHIMQSTSKFYNAHSTSIVYTLPMVLMVGADVDFKLHAGVISLPGNVLRFAVKDWRAAVALKVLRRRVREILASSWKSPGRQLSGRETEWLGIFFKIFKDKFEKDERLRERVGGKGK